MEIWLRRKTLCVDTIAPPPTRDVGAELGLSCIASWFLKERLHASSALDEIKLPAGFLDITYCISVMTLSPLRKRACAERAYQTIRRRGHGGGG